jgi:excisionase family DNA binding protein
LHTMQDESIDNPIEVLWDSEQTARYLKIHPRTVVRKARAGEIPGFQIGNQWRFRPSDLDQWMDSLVISHQNESPVRVN